MRTVRDAAQRTGPTGERGLVRNIVGRAKVRLQMAVNRAGWSVTRQVPIDRQAALLEAARPWQTEHPLIRVGGAGDGGYLLPDDLDGIAACFSPGVSNQATFEEDLLARGIPCFQADASVERSPVQDHPLVRFERLFLGPSTEREFISLQDWVERHDPSPGSDLLLQMDIEGAEWLVLACASDELLGRFRIICIEFHGLEQLFSPFAFRVMAPVFEKLLRQFHVIHIHPNNWTEVAAVSPRYRVPSVLEYTFLRKDRVKQKSPALRFPHPLDRDCNPRGPTVVLPSSMYQFAGGTDSRISSR